MTSPLLSVIIPAYNVGNYIVECIDSLLSQIPSPNELIIINDGSTDNTLALVEKEYGMLDHVKVVTIPNGGLGNARDVGIQMAKGQYIFCCDPDDVVCNGLFQELKEVTERHPGVDLFCFNSLMFEDGNPSKTYGKVQHREFGLMPSQSVFKSLLRSGAYTSATWNYVLKKEVIDIYQLKYVKRLHEDHSFTLEAFLRARNAFVSRHLYYKQRIRNGSLTNSEKSESFFRQRYDAFVCSYEKLVSVVDDAKQRAELRRLYLIHSFKLMINLSLADNRRVPDYVMQSIHYLGKNLKPGSFVNWLLLRSPALYSTLIKFRRRLRGMTHSG